MTEHIILGISVIFNIILVLAIGIPIYLMWDYD